jgi:prepilin-type N-terminal cleavage/methylation domain-containing protein
MGRLSTVGATGSRRGLHRTSGFTLIEIMTVVSIIAITAALAVRMMSRNTRGEMAPGFARTVLSTAHQARQAAIVDGRPVRLTVQKGTTTTRLLSEIQQADGTWVKLDGLEPATRGIEFCDPDAAATLTSATPTCPASLDTEISFSKSGTCGSYFGCVTKQGTTVIANPTSGATIYFRTIDDQKHYKVVIWGLTGLPRLFDTW